MPSLGHLGPPKGSNPRLRCQRWVRGMLKRAGVRSSRIPHRFYTEADIELDVLPLDPQAERRQEIYFPDGTRISAVGLAESLRCSSEVDVE